MADERVLVTGGTGCIGSWVVRDLLREDVPVVVLSVDRQFDRLKLVLTEAEFERITFLITDIAEIDAVEAEARRHGINRIIHLAAMQFPFCAADPIRGAQVNVAGTVTVFELAKRLGVDRVVYASSAAVYGPASRYPQTVLPPDAPFFPTSHYGVYKVANEGTARVYWENDGISSIGLRPHSVYGPGRDQGVTSKPTVAMIAAAAARPYHVNFGGSYQFQFVDDVARAFIRATRAPEPGAAAYSLGGSAFGVDEILRGIEAQVPAVRGRLTHDDRLLPFPAAFDGGPIAAALGLQAETPLEEGIRLTIDAYRAGMASGLIDEAYLDRVLA
jgi:nucleoside-diphosphate-sugar epimerase